MADRSYFTVASVEEVNVTESTLDVTAEASGLAAKALIADENSEPFCSSWARSLLDVEELKNLFQLVVISDTALDDAPPLAAVLEEAAGAVVDAGVLAAVEAVEDEELEPLEQADITVTSIRPSAGAR
ncbi:MAG TPA: hypothetical protein VHT26_02225 [Trebonia sp.]|jgi:hypothetical protein|nr:hypothetical protein [Trebonia sp.]